MFIAHTFKTLLIIVYISQRCTHVHPIDTKFKDNPTQRDNKRTHVKVIVHECNSILRWMDTFKSNRTGMLHTSTMHGHVLK